ncbi:MAG: LPXTG cell wall anchor domain-containing protein, partial [Bacilli bacterium]
LVRLPDEVTPETPLPETEQPEIPEVSIPNEDVTDTVQPEPEVNVKPESQTQGKLPTTGQQFGVLALAGAISATAGVVISRKRSL